MRFDLTIAIINPPFFHDHRKRSDRPFQATVLINLNDSTALNGATKCPVHNQMIDINRMGAFQHGLSFDKQSPCCDPTGARLLHIKAGFSLATEMTAEGPFDPGGTADDPRIAKRPFGVNPKMPTRVDGS